MDKIKTLEKALNDLGIKTKLYPEMVWSCTDGKKHHGIELDTNIVCDCDTVEFLFTPSGEYIYSALDAPILQEEKVNKNEKRRKKK